MSSNKDVYDAIYPPFVTFNMRVKKQLDSRTSTKRIQVLNLKINDFLWGNIIGPPVGMCIRKQSCIQIGGFSAEYYPSIDYLFFAKVALKFKSCKLFGYPLSIYRIGENESCKTDTLMQFISCDTAIKKKILDSYISQSLRFLWYSYINVYVYKYLEVMKTLFQNKEIEINKNLKALGYNYNLLDKFTYKLFMTYKLISFKVRSSTFDIQK